MIYFHLSIQKRSYQPLKKKAGTLNDSGLLFICSSSQWKIKSRVELFQLIIG